ncbi:MAG: ABC transporter ATP-binding protein [Actinomycetota bacterium]|nr:ABC transporter ATP-binding protein [Actinomycetota bacterium]
MNVELTDVTKRYGSVRALDGVTLSLSHGVTGLLGPNGAGKTTLMRILSTLLAPTKGTVRIDGLDPTHPRERLALRRRLGYLPQDLGLYPRFTVFEFVDYVAILKELRDRRERHLRVAAALRAVGLGEVAGRRIKTLSGGMARRVGIAQALVAEPDLMILDEPTAGLDPQQRARFRELLASLGDRRQVVLSTHLVEDVAAICTSVVVLWAGRAVFHGTPAELRESARGMVWSSAEPVRGALASWRTESGTYRVVGGRPQEPAEELDPTVEDGYLLLTSALQEPVPA